jgi:hypothetical protein
MLRFALFLFVSLLLTACATPTRLGISETEWENYSPAEQQKIKRNYYSILQGRGRCHEKIIPDGSTVHVKISEGKIVIPPSASLHDYKPLEFTLRSGECHNIQICEEGTDKHTSMKACYRNKTLYLDPSRYEPEKSVGSIRLHYSPIWDRGFTYQPVSSTGYVHLNNVKVTVKRD